MNKRNVIIHYHIYKNAGTSLAESLGRALKGGLHYFDFFGKPGAVITREALGQYLAMNTWCRAVSSHQTVLPPPEMEGVEFLSVVLFRKPLSRFQSIYKFERKRSAAGWRGASAKLAGELSINDFYANLIEREVAWVSNFQTRFCSREDESGDSDLEKAKQNLRDSVCGLVEEVEPFVKRLRSRCGLKLSFKHLNSTSVRSGGESLSPQIRRELEKRNVLDEELYDWVRSSF